jgi:hypothetical protein
MLVPDLYDIYETSRKVRMSVSWLYHNADRLHVTRMGRRLFWTDAAIALIIAERTDATPTAKAHKARQERKKSAPKKQSARPVGDVSNIPQPNPARARRLRQVEAAA